MKIGLTLALLLSMTSCGPLPNQEPPLHDAAHRGNAAKVRELLRAGTPVDSVNREGATPLHWAAFQGHLDVAKLLLNSGADVNALTKKGSTPLRLATSHKKIALIVFLKSRGGIVR